MKMKNYCVIMYLLINFVVLGYFTGVTASNCFLSTEVVCNGEHPEIPHLPSRHPEFIMTAETQRDFCDVYAINTSVWYKTETSMSTYCPSMYMCGAKLPIWLNGQNPVPEAGVANLTACLRDFDNCCLHTYDLTVVNCGNFMAYCFVDLPSSCNQRFCFGHVSTTKPQQTRTTPASSTTTPHYSTEKSVTATNADTTILKFSTSTTWLNNSTESSAGTKDTLASANTTPFEYSSTTTTHDRSSESSVALISTSSYEDKTTQHVGTKTTSAGVIVTSTLAASSDDDDDDDANLLTIALSVIGLMAAVICGLVIFIIRHKRASINNEETTKANVYDTLKNPDVKAIKETERENEYQIVTFDNLGVTDEIEGYKTCFTNADYQLTTTKKELNDDDEHYVTLP